MEQRLKRQPRNPAYFWSYAGHIAQGFICGLAMPLVWLPLAYIAYQCIEWICFWKRNEAGKFLADDHPSRDIADFMAGGWIGSAFGIPLWWFIVLPALLDKLA